MAAVPIRVPTVSNRSTNRKANTMAAKFTKCPATKLKSNLKKVGARDGGRIPLLKLGIRE